MSAEIRRLLVKWRTDADADVVHLKQYCYGGDLDGDMLDEDIERGFTVAATRRTCADELEAVLLAAPAVPAPQLTENKEENLSRVDRSALSDGQDLPRKPQPDGSQ